MVLTPFQRQICRLLAQQRKANGESYVAGGAALNEVVAAPRISRALDLFHDTREALSKSWSSDREALERHGYEVVVVRERPSYVEAIVRSGSDSVLIEWAADSAFRFFPLVEHAELGLTLHPFDLATNKVLALVGRVEPRDWIDTMQCDGTIQPLGLIVWAACGKDPGWSPSAILEHTARSARYSESEIAALDFEGSPPDAADLSKRWRALLARAREMVEILPPEHVGECAIAGRELFRGTATELRELLQAGTITFHKGSIRGAWPELKQP